MAKEFIEATRDWRSAFEQDMGRRYTKYDKKERCTLIDSDLQRKINRNNKLRLQQLKDKLLH
jgi:hypothetical protein